MEKKNLYCKICGKAIAIDSWKKHLRNDPDQNNKIFCCKECAKRINLI